MAYDSLFDTDENRTLLAICARKLISNIGIGAIIWGVINLLIGIAAIQANPINVGLLILGAIMLGTGVQAVKSPSLGVLLTEVLVSVLLFGWNLAISILNFKAMGEFEPRGLIFPIVIAAVFYGNYRKLQHVREQISSVEKSEIKRTKEICKKLVKKKLKEEPSIVQSADRKCRAQFMPDRALFIQRDLMRAFVATKEQVAATIAKPDAKRLTMNVHHPLGKLKYAFDKKNSQKIKDWLASETPMAEPEATPPVVDPTAEIQQEIV